MALPQWAWLRFLRGGRGHVNMHERVLSDGRGRVGVVWRGFVWAWPDGRDQRVLVGGRGHVGVGYLFLLGAWPYGRE